MLCIETALRPYLVLLHLSLLFRDSYSIPISLARVISTAFRCFGLFRFVSSTGTVTM